VEEISRGAKILEYQNLSHETKWHKRCFGEECFEVFGSKEES
jgi:hypothetical protein